MKSGSAYDASVGVGHSPSITHHPSPITPFMPSLLIVAGDPSGDRHAARLLQQLRARLPGITAMGLGGPALREAGVTLLDDVTHRAAIGPFDAASQVRHLWRARQQVLAAARQQPPDLALLVDFGDFNLPFIAPYLKRLSIPIAYYISPQLWAWGQFRLQYVKRFVDRMIVFFPFEATFYQRAGVPVTWVGHPLIDDAIPTRSPSEMHELIDLNPRRMTVGLLPGSRYDEVRRLLPVMLQAAVRVSRPMPALQWIVPRASSVPLSLFQECTAGLELNVRITEGPLPEVLQLMDVACVASGTATLEAAIAHTPMVVVYRTSWPTYCAARAVVRLPHVALVNIVAQRHLVPELLQWQASPRRIARALTQLLRDDAKRHAMRTALGEVTQHLGGPGAVDRAAEAVLALLRMTRPELSKSKTR